MAASWILGGRRAAADCGSEVQANNSQERHLSKRCFSPAAPSARLPALAVLLLSALSGCSTLAGAPPDVLIHNGSSRGSALTFSPDSTMVAVGTLDGSVRLWQSIDGELVASWRAHRGPVYGLLALDGERYLSAGYDGRLAIWRLPGRLLQGWSAGAPVTALGGPPTSGHVLTGHSDGSVKLWTLDGVLVQQWRPHESPVRAVTWDPESGQFASSGHEGRVALWSRHSPPRALPSPPTDAMTLVFVEGTDALLGGGWFSLYRWELPAGTLRRLATDHRGVIKSISRLPDGRIASISGQTDSSVLILDPATGATVGRLQRHELCGATVAVSPHGGFIASTSDDATVRIWHTPPPSTASLHEGNW